MLMVFAASVASAAVSGCYWFNTHDLVEVAERVRAADSPLIHRVFYTPGDILEPQELNVVLIQTAGDAEAATVWCEVLLPAGADHDTVVSDGAAEMVWPRPASCPGQP